LEEVTIRYTIRFSGAGGQGLIQAARILAEAAAIYDSKYAVENCSYGPEARGGSSRAEIIVSDQAIDSPTSEEVDLLLALSQEAFDKYIGDLAPAGIVVTDHQVHISAKAKDRKVYSAPLMQIAEKECGRPAIVNIVALGFFAEICRIVDKNSIRRAILARVPKTSEHYYIEAYDAGLKEAAQQLGN
jgi:2-oxoglutarate ferredoxin oxidoreductase subunit gamma